MMLLAIPLSIQGQIGQRVKKTSTKVNTPMVFSLNFGFSRPKVPNPGGFF
jgi:hypothetical protein